MPWKETPNVAQYKGADWTNLVTKVPNCTVEQAKRIALTDPHITFFFFVREPMFLEGKAGSDGWTEKGQFSPGDAVFFRGEPWYGSAPQCDAYEKHHMTIIYAPPQAVKEIGCYTLADGSPAIDLVCLSAGNLVLSQPPYLRANNDPNAKSSLGADLQAVLEDGSVKALQDQGITVLLTILNGHHDAGWSCFGTEETAKNFADYLISEVVDKYGLDGIDIDDEYSRCTTYYPSSLVMVTAYMHEAKAESIISKALFSDLEYFTPQFQGKTLADTLTYGWEMSYGGDPQSRLPPYVEVGMAKSTLSLGFWKGQLSKDPARYVQWVTNQSYAGVMLYPFEGQANIDLMGVLVNALCGPGNWNFKPKE